MFLEFASGFFGDKKSGNEGTADGRTISSSSVSSHSEAAEDLLVAAIVKEEQDDYDRSHDLSTYLEPLLERRVEVFTIPLHLANRYDHNDEVDASDEGMYDNYFEKAIIFEDTLPKGSPERNKLEDYLSSFNVNEYTECIAKTLVGDPIIRAHMSAVVPQQVSYEDFWARYFYRCSPQSIAGLNMHEGQTDILKLTRSPSCVIRETLELLEECESVQLY